MKDYQQRLSAIQIFPREFLVDLFLLDHLPGMPLLRDS
jgi:hypothetical protein